MRLFIKTKGAGWGGYDFVVNREAPTAKKCTLEKSNGTGWSWTKAGNVDYMVSGREIQISIPREMLGIDGEVNFEFKWHDNMQDQGNTDDFMTCGDAGAHRSFQLCVPYNRVEKARSEHNARFGKNKFIRGKNYEIDEKSFSIGVGNSFDVFVLYDRCLR